MDGSGLSSVTGTLLQVYEDTEFLPGKQQLLAQTPGGKSAGDFTESFAPYEDTEFLGKDKEAEQ